MFEHKQKNIMIKVEDKHNWIGKKVRILLHLEDHVGYKGQELTITAVFENNYLTVVDKEGVEWSPGIEETDYENFYVD